MKRDQAMDLRRNGSVLYISSADVSIGNGPGVNEREFILALHEAIGDRAHFLIPRPVGEAPDLPLSACTFSRPHRRHNPKYFPGHVLSQMQIADRILSHRQFELILFRLDVLPFAPFYITAKHRAPYALKTLGQGLMNSLAESGGKVGQSLMGINRWLVRRIVDRALVADSVSTIQVDYLQNLLGIASDKIVWIDNAVNTRRFSPSRTTDARRELGLANFDPIVGYVGTRAWERGGMQMIEASPQLLSKYPNLGLVILGDGKGLDDLRTRARELRVENHCLFTGYVPFDTVPLYVNSLDVGVSMSSRQDRSAASELKVRQYLACGKPVVISSGSNDFVTTEDFGSVLDPTDTDAVATELDRWLRLTSNQRGEFASRVRKYVQDNLSIEVAIAKRFEIWEQRLQVWKTVHER